MVTIIRSIDDIIDDTTQCPFPINVIPDNMGINLNSVEAIVITCLDGLKMFDCLNVRNRIVEIIRDGKYKVTKGWKTTKSNKRVRTYAIEL